MYNHTYDLPGFALLKIRARFVSSFKMATSSCCPSVRMCSSTSATRFSRRHNHFAARQCDRQKVTWIRRGNQVIHRPTWNLLNIHVVSTYQCSLGLFVFLVHLWQLHQVHDNLLLHPYHFVDSTCNLLSSRSWIFILQDTTYIKHRIYESCLRSQRSFLSLR